MPLLVFGQRGFKSMKRVSLLFLVAVVSVMATSCITGKKINYLQDMTPETQIQLENKFEAVISPYDELNIRVSSYDAELARPFNLGGGVNNNSNSVNTSLRVPYLVDVNGNIQFPVLGEIHVAGLTRLQLQDTIAKMLINENYIADPFVMVRFNTFKIFFLGAEGGKAISISNERCTFLEALALAGDLNSFTRRDRIAVLREVDGKMTMRYLDPRSSTVFNDPYFMLQQNDFIITEKVNGGTVRTETSYWLGWLSTAVSVTSLITSLMVYLGIKNNQ